MAIFLILSLSKNMLHSCRRFFTTNKKILTDRKKKILVENFFNKYDKNKKIREALKYGEEELKKKKKK